MIGLFDRDGHLTELAAFRVSAGELSVESPELAAHLATCPECTARLAQFRADVAAPLPPLRQPRRPQLRVVSRDERALSEPALTEPASSGGPPGSAPEPVPAARPRSRRWMLPLGGLGLLAAAAALLLVKPPEPEPEVFTARGAEVSLEVSLEVYRNATTGVERLEDGATVKPGDHLGFRVVSSRQGDVRIVGRDGTGRAWPVSPAAGAIAVTVPPDGAPLADAAVVLDATPGSERFILLVCPSALAWDDVVLAVERAPAVADTRLPPLFPGCAQDEVRLSKVIAP